MGKCEFFNEKVKLIEDKRLSTRRNPGPPTRLIWAWCTHKHSPVDEEMAMTLGHGQDLKCQGDIQKCPLSPADFRDT